MTPMIKGDPQSPVSSARACGSRMAGLLSAMLASLSCACHGQGWRERPVFIIQVLPCAKHHSRFFLQGYPFYSHHACEKWVLLKFYSTDRHTEV